MTTLDTISNNAPVQNPLGGPAPIRSGQHDPSPPRGVALQALMLPLAVVVIVAFFTIVSPGHVFLGTRNLSMLAIELSITAALALGMLLVILPGHIDLSVGSGAGLVGGVAAVLINQQGWSAPAAMVVSTAGALVLWLLMGAIIVRQRVPAFIITLGGLLIFRGLQWRAINNGTVPITNGVQANIYTALTTFYIPPTASLILAAAIIAILFANAVLSYRNLRRAGVSVDGESLFMRTFIGAQVVLLFVLVCNGYRGVPLSALILGAIALAIHTLIRHTPYGRYLYAIGGNEEAAILSGVPVSRVVIGAFGMMGLLTAVTGFMQTAYAGASTTTVGSLMELDAVAACVIGGVSLRGGRGTVGGVLLGSLIMATLLNGMTLMAYSPEAKYIIRGLVLAIAVWADVRLSRQ